MVDKSNSKNGVKSNVIIENQENLDDTTQINQSRRNILAAFGAAAVGVSGILTPFSAKAVNSSVSVGANGSNLREVKIGFIALTDAASIIMASMLGFDEKRGIKFKLVKFNSWASLRDGLANGSIDCAHCLYGMAIGMAGGYDPSKNADVRILMGLHQNGQGISLSNFMKKEDLDKKVKAANEKGKQMAFANTYPTGTHAMWLNYWLASLGINPAKEIERVTIAPANMVANLMGGSLAGFCVGEPWNGRAIVEGVGYTAITSQDIWAGHPEKCLACLPSFEANKEVAVSTIGAILESSKWLDANDANREKAVEVLALRKFINSPVNSILPRFIGEYDNGRGKKWQDKNRVSFYEDGAVNYPYITDAVWFMTQHKRWGFVKDINYEKLANKVLAVSIYEEAANANNVNLPKDGYRKVKLFDGLSFDAKKPDVYLSSLQIKA